MSRNKLRLLSWVFSPLGLLPILAGFLIAGNDFFKALSDPGQTYNLIAGNFKNIMLVVVGNLGDVLGYYVIVLIIAIHLWSYFKKGTLGRIGLGLLMAYGVNGAIWALLNAVIMGYTTATTTAANRELFIQVSSFVSRTGWGVIGNTLGSLGWIALGSYILTSESKLGMKVLGVFTLVLGVMYMLGGITAGNFVPATLGMVGISFYLFFALVWNIVVVYIVPTTN